MSCARECSRSGASSTPALELRDQLQMLAQRERAVDPLLADERALLIEPCGSDLRVTFQRDIGERVPAPERERLIVSPQRLRVVVRRRPRREPSAVSRPNCADIQRGASRLEHVPRRPRRDL